MVADSRDWARVSNLQSITGEVLWAIEHSDDSPVGLNFMAASGAAEVTLLESGRDAGAIGDAFHVLYRNSRSEPVMLLELRSGGVDEHGYEQLSFESLLAFSDGVDGESLSIGRITCLLIVCPEYRIKWF